MFTRAMPDSHDKNKRPFDIIKELSGQCARKPAYLQQSEIDAHHNALSAPKPRPYPKVSLRIYSARDGAVFVCMAGANR